MSPHEKCLQPRPVWHVTLLGYVELRFVLREPGARRDDVVSLHADRIPRAPRERAASTNSVEELVTIKVPASSPLLFTTVPVSPQTRQWGDPEHRCRKEHGNECEPRHQDGG